MHGPEKPRAQALAFGGGAAAGAAHRGGVVDPLDAGLEGAEAGRVPELLPRLAASGKGEGEGARVRVPAGGLVGA